VNILWEMNENGDYDDIYASARPYHTWLHCLRDMYMFQAKRDFRQDQRFDIWNSSYRLITDEIGLAEIIHHGFDGYIIKLTDKAIELKQ
tara:strand:+ start:80 stop:346 length:267 start_codon:yes stop_codon:yes gene_type:complete